MKIAFLGLGVMGYPTAGHLANAGHEVTVYNRTQAKSEQWVEQYQGKLAHTPVETVRDADVVLACVGKDEHLRELLLGNDGAFDAMKKGSLFIDHTTASAEIARELDEAARERGFAFLDAPVSGGQAGAESGQLSIMVGGQPTDFVHGSTVMNVYGKSVRLMGPAGSGQLTKMVNQICVAGLIQSLAEGLHFAQAAGLDGEAVMSVLCNGAASSWQMENRHQTMLKGEYDFGFAVDWMRKDLDIAMREAQSNGIELPVTEMVDQFYGDVQNIGGGRWDTSSLLTRLKDKK
jgi:3-hydroxyisobutyrate dehydrogenase-like beta-hydroxyacid dehydrogenase